MPLRVQLGDWLDGTSEFARCPHNVKASDKYVW